MPAQPVVVVVEDHSGLGEVIRDVLSEEGYDVVTVRDQYAAMGELRHRSVDLVVADLTPRVGEGDPLAEIRTTFPDLPTIVVGEVESEAMPFFGPWRASGPHLTLRRPFRLDDLVAASRHLVG